MNNILPIELTNFIIVLVISLLIGLSQRKHFAKKSENMHLGTDRTYTLIGLLGYVMYLLQPETMTVYIAGGVALFVLIALFYSYKLFKLSQTGMTSLLIALLTYGIGPLVYLTQLWVVIMIVVSILILNEMKTAFIRFSQKMNEQEFMNLAKFLVISGVVLPVLPDEEFIEGVALTPYNIWLTTVVISGFSYISYLLKRYVFNQSGIIVSGLLGGIYSSMATTVILSRKAANVKEEELGNYITAIFCSVATLYIKYAILLGIFNFELLKKYWFIFAGMFITGMLVATFYFFKEKRDSKKNSSTKLADSNQSQLELEEEDKNPLEFQIAILFAVLFVVFTFITSYVIKSFGADGLHVLSILVGATDITPFILNLFQAKYEIEDSMIIIATFQAIISTNIVKMIYGIILSKKRIIRCLLAGFSIISLANIGLLLLV